MMQCIGSVRVSGTGWSETHGVLIAPDREHECMAMDENLLADDLVIPFKDRIMERINADDPVGMIASIVEDFFVQLQGSSLEKPESAHSIDPGIVRAMAAMKESLEAPLSLMRLSSIAGLSEGRMMHLFKDVVGNSYSTLLPMAAYESGFSGDSCRKRPHRSGP